MAPPPPPAQGLLEAPPDEDKRLVLAFKAGDEDSYREIYERHSAVVRRITRRMLSNSQDAEEAFQETFLKVYTALGRFNGRYQLGAWIARIATNVCLDQLRSRKRHPVDSVEPEFLDGDLELDTESSDPEHHVIRRHETRRVRRVLEQLPPMHRAAIVLRDFEGLSYAEVAKALDINECQTKALIHRARKGFKRSWAEVLSVLIPWRVLRLRKFEGAEQSASGWMPSAHAVASCSNLAQQCVQAFGERLAPLATAAMVTGVAAAGPALVGNGPAEAPVAPERAVVLVSADGDRDAIPRDDSPQQRPAMEPVAPSPADDEVTEPKDVDPSEDPGTGGETVTPPPAEPQPEPTTTAPAPSPTPVAPVWAEEPAAASLAFDIARPSSGEVCSCLGPTTTESESSQRLPKGWRVQQTMSGNASANGNQAYGLRITQTVESTSHRLHAVVHTNKGGYTYSASAALTGSRQNAYGGWTYTFSGNYSLSSWSERDDAAFPPSGTYSATVELSRSGERVLSTSILFQ